jgi:large subunit ribosomal protein L10
MPTQEKVASVAELKEQLERATIVMSGEYRGMTVKEMQTLRRKLREGGLEVKVVKNTLLRIAANEAGKAEVTEIVEGPTALAMAYGDIIEAAKAITDYANTAPQAFSLRGGYLDGAVLSANDLKDLAKIPPRPVLLAQFMGLMESPLVGFLGLMESPLREFHGLVEARATQLEAA